MPVIDETQATKALRHAQIRSRQQWQRDGASCALEEYEDCAMAALSGCLARFDPSRGVQFSTYAEYRINGALHDAQEHYDAWRHGINTCRWKQAPPNTDVLRPLQGPQADPVLRCWFLRQTLTLGRYDGGLLVRLLAGEELADIAKAEGITYIACYKRYRHLMRTLKGRLSSPHLPG